MTPHAAHIVHLNVGGVYFSTLRSTLTESDSFFSGALRHHHDCELFVDRDPTHFRHILNWLRGVRCLPEEDAVLHELACEADYYCMTDLKAAIVKTGRRYSTGRALTAIATEMGSRGGA